MNETVVITKYNHVPVEYTINQEAGYYQLASVGYVTDCQYRFNDFASLSYTVNVLARSDMNERLYKYDDSQLYYVGLRGGNEE